MFNAIVTRIRNRLAELLDYGWWPEATPGGYWVLVNRDVMRQIDTLTDGLIIDLTTSRAVKIGPRKLEDIRRTHAQIKAARLMRWSPAHLRRVNRRASSSDQLDKLKVMP